MVYQISNNPTFVDLAEITCIFKGYNETHVVQQIWHKPKQVFCILTATRLISKYFTHFCSSNA